MSGDRAEHIEAGVDRLAAAICAVATAFAFSKLVPIPLMERVALAAATGVLGYLLLVQALASVAAGKRTLRLPEFKLADFEPVELDELLLTELPELILTEADRLPAKEVYRPDELLLDDILTEIGAESRVVRLFDPAAMPTPGQLNARIERHLNQGSPPAAPPDASQALYDALADLRRSLR
jgi:hypothetical protein